mgnify:FL=1
MPKEKTETATARKPRLSLNAIVLSNPEALSVAQEVLRDLRTKSNAVKALPEEILFLVSAMLDRQGGEA